MSSNAKKHLENILKFYDQEHLSKAFVYDFTKTNPAPQIKNSHKGKNNFYVSINDTLSETNILCKKYNYKEHPCALNFANEYNTGGGWTGKKGSQEESLFLNSSLPLSLWPLRREDDNRLKDFDTRIPRAPQPSYPYKEATAIYSPYVTGDQKCYFSVISIAAQDLRKRDYTKSYDEELTKQKLRSLLWVAYHHKHRHVVLGAIGCGAFKNDPKKISKIFYDLLTGEFKDCFDNVSFAIPSGQKNIKAFQDTFSSKTSDKNTENDNILFYEPKEPYYEFSNFYKTSIEYNGKIYPSSEHLYQAMKFMKDPNDKKSMEYADIIRQQSTANKAFILAGQKTGGGYKWRLDLNPIIKKYQDVKIRDDWEQNKVKIMKDILMIKFSDNKLKKLLLDTNNKNIIEDSPRDNFWGIGKKKDGKNMLGKLLMEVRENLKESKKEDDKQKSPDTPKDPCPKGKIMNPKTKRCVKEDGKIGKEIIKKNKGNDNVKRVEKVKPQFKDNKVLNPATGRYVLKTGKIGKKILKDLND